MICTTNAAMQAPEATVIKLRSKKAKMSETTSPATADAVEAVEYRIEGIVIAANTAYGM